MLKGFVDHFDRTRESTLVKHIFSSFPFAFFLPTFLSFLLGVVNKEEPEGGMDRRSIARSFGNVVMSVSIGVAENISCSCIIITSLKL